MDYKKAYEEVLERAKSYQKWNKSAVITAIFPELKENEDERIRKALISILTSDFEKDTTIDGITVEEILVWLEKQGEQKPADKVEPEFKVGDWIVGANSVYKIISLNDELNCYIAVTTNNEEVKIPYFFDCAQGHMCSYHLWTIQDAKDGDVLQFKGRPFIYNGYLEEKKYPFAYGGIYLDGSFFISNGLLPWTHSDVYPATKEQRDILFHEMKEAGYEWNAEKKELKKIERKSIEWTEEDTNMFGSIRSTLSMYMNNLSLPKEIRDIHKKELEWFDELYDRGLS